MDRDSVGADSLEETACTLYLQAGGESWETCSRVERRLALYLAEERSYREQAEARLRAFGDAAQCFGV